MARRGVSATYTDKFTYIQQSEPIKTQIRLNLIVLLYRVAQKTGNFLAHVTATEPTEGCNLTL